MKFYVFCLIIICLCLTGCRNLELVELEISDEAKSIESLIKDMYTDEELEKINNLELNYDALNKKYKVECLRKINDDNYKAIYRSKNKFLFVIFDKEGKKKSSFMVAVSPNKKEFESLKIGSHILEVEKVDNTQDYTVGNLSSSSSSKITHHFTNDGFQVTIFYDKNFNILEVNYELL